MPGTYKALREDRLRSSAGTMLPRILPVIAAISASLACGWGGDPCAPASGTIKSALLPACFAKLKNNGDEALAVRLAIASSAAGDKNMLSGVADQLALRVARAVSALQVGNLLLAHQDLVRARALLDRAFVLSRTAGSHGEAARAAYGLYAVASNQSALRAAFDALELTRYHAELAKDRGLIWRAAMGMFEVLFEVGSLDAASDALERAKVFVTPAQSNEWKHVIFREAILAYEQGRLAQARNIFEQVRLLNEQSAAPEPTLRWHLAINLLETDLKARDLPNGRQSLAEAEAMLRDRRFTPTANSEVALLYNRARFHQLDGSTERALGDVDRAIALAKSPQWLWQLWSLRGELYQSSGKPNQAGAAYERAIQTIIAMAAETGNDDLKASVLANKELPFSRLTELQIRAGDLPAALATLERSRARAFIDAFATGSYPESEKSGPRNPREAAETPHERLDFVTQTLPRLRALPGSSEVATPMLLERLAGLHVLVYAESEDGLFILELTRSNLRVHTRPIPSRELWRLASAFVAEPHRTELADRLGALLFPPEIRLGGETLHIAPSAALTRLPFAAVRRGGRFLVEECAPVFVPNLTWLAQALGPRSEERPRHAGAAVVLGDPDLDLPGAGREAKTVGDLLHVEPVTGRNAGETVFKTAMGARILHLNGHAGVDAAGPWLALAGKRLRALDILALKPPPRTVVLSSCASGATADPGLWGSPAAAFLSAGARTVVASLRSIVDGAAVGLMAEFYRQGGDTRPVAALAQVQRRLSKTSPPQSWAAFVALGTD